MWKNLGKIFAVDGQAQWMHTHAMVPTPWLMDNRIRVFFSCRDTRGKSHIGYADLSRSDPTRVLGVSQEPVLAPGPAGTFFDSGVTVDSIVADGKDVRMYFIGWNQMVSVPYRNSIGMAVSHDGANSFACHGQGPIMERTPEEPYFCTSPWVLKDRHGWHMWYACVTEWVEINGKQECLYHIKYASSQNGIDWQRPGIDCIPPQNRYEANVRPTVLYDGTLYRMWYCYRGSFDFRDGADSYRLGYAESADGKQWKRLDDRQEMFPPRAEWDNLMQAYPAMLEADGRLLMFYNGNGFGREGFGAAIWESGK